MNIVLFLLGGALGSFLNVLTLRYDPEKKYSFKTVGGRSHCLYCGRQLRWYELVPLLSYIMQWGKCRGCKKHISLQYPIIELVMGLVCVFTVRFFLFHGSMFSTSLLPASYHAYLFSLLWIIIFGMLLAALIIDLRHYVIPNRLNLGVFIGGIVWTGMGAAYDFSSILGQGSFLGQFAALFTFSSNFFINHLLAGFLAAIFFLLIVIITRGKGMGMGDVKLMAALGVLFGWPDIGAIAIMSFMLGTLAAIPLLLMRKKKASDKVPFGPYIVLACVLVFFFGSSILRTYFDIIQSLAA